MEKAYKHAAGDEKSYMLCKSRICLKAWIVQFEHGD